MKLVDAIVFGIIVTKGDRQLYRSVFDNNPFIVVKGLPIGNIFNEELYNGYDEDLAVAYLVDKLDEYSSLATDEVRDCIPEDRK